MKLSVVIPCYNEAKTIRTIVDRVRASGGSASGTVGCATRTLRTSRTI